MTEQYKKFLGSLTLEELNNHRYFNVPQESVQFLSNYMHINVKFNEIDDNEYFSIRLFNSNKVILLSIYNGNDYEYIVDRKLSKNELDTIVNEVSNHWDDIINAFKKMYNGEEIKQDKVFPAFPPDYSKLSIEK